MRDERLFTTWEEGLVYLLFVVLIPIIPLLVYLVMNTSEITAYFYVLILAVLVPLVYEFFNIKYHNIRVLFEKLVILVLLIVILVWDIGLLFFHIQSDTAHTISWQEIVIVVLLCGAPFITILVEIVCCIINSIKEKKQLIDEDNLVKGGGHV